MKINEEKINKIYLIVVLILLSCLLLLLVFGILKINTWETILKILPSIITSFITVIISYLGFSMIIVQLKKTDDGKRKNEIENEKIRRSLVRPLWHIGRSQNGKSDNIQFLSLSHKDIFVRDVKIWEIKYITKDRIDNEINRIKDYLYYLDPWINLLGSSFDFSSTRISPDKIKEIKYSYHEYIPPRLERVEEIRNSLYSQNLEGKNMCIPIKVALIGSVKEGTKLKDYHSNRIENNFELLTNLSEEANSKLIIESYTDFNEHIFTYIDNDKNIFLNLVEKDKIKSIFPDSLHIEEELKQSFFKAVDAVNDISFEDIGTLNQSWDLYNQVKHLVSVMDGAEYENH
ncbi:MAG: hypothetical protein RR638_00890 [Carnobacterium sp.]|uniref:hypothetical protein n=1 Tax=Carnobacterium sp. TaxID=48221 RepID=UPI002FCAB989